MVVLVARPGHVIGRGVRRKMSLPVTAEEILKAGLFVILHDVRGRASRQLVGSDTDTRPMCAG